MATARSTWARDGVVTVLKAAPNLRNWAVNKLPDHLRRFSRDPDGRIYCAASQLYASAREESEAIRNGALTTFAVGQVPSCPNWRQDRNPVSVLRHLALKHREVPSRLETPDSPHVLIVTIAVAIAHSARAKIGLSSRPTARAIMPARSADRVEHDQNVAGSRTIPGKGWSSPIVQDGRLLTTRAVGATSRSRISPCKRSAWTRRPVSSSGSRGLQSRRAEIPAIMARQSCQPDAAHGWQLLVTSATRAALPRPRRQGALAHTELRYNPVHGAGATPIRVTTGSSFPLTGRQAFGSPTTRHGQGNLEDDRKCTARRNLGWHAALIAVDGKKRKSSARVRTW